MYTGIVQAVLPITGREEFPGYTKFTLKFSERMLSGLQIGASVALDGLCLTVVAIEGDFVSFDATDATKRIATIGDRVIGECVNVERSAKAGDENGGHVMAGHVTGTADIVEIETGAAQNSIRFRIPAEHTKYVFPKGFLSLNGASLTVAEGDPMTAIYQVNLIPETIRQTTFSAFKPGGRLNFEIEHQTMILVDTLERCFKMFMPVDLGFE